MFKFFRHLRYRKMISVSSSFILDELANLIDQCISEFEKTGKVKIPLHKEVLKFESTALVFWSFRVSDIFPKPMHRLLLDKIHDQYYGRLKKHGYNNQLVQTICNKLNLRYRTYDGLKSESDFSKVGARFARFVSEEAKTDLDAHEINFALSLLKQTTDKFAEFRKVMA